MAGKIIIHGLKQNVLNGRISFFINEKLVAEVSPHETIELPIECDSDLTWKVGIRKSKEVIHVKKTRIAEYQIEYDRIWGKILVKEINVTVCEFEEPNDDELIYDLLGARGRYLKVYNDKCVITTKAGAASFITGNATDGEKTIYFSDLIGVQIKKPGITIGYIQFETAAGTMNNKSDNFFNENSFTFEKNVSWDLDEVVNFIKKKIDEIKRNKNAPIVMAAQSSADELKKFKELLDMGIISQEEFDAKKKQLLGL